MSLSMYAPETPPEETVRTFLGALVSPRVIDALDAFAVDAVIRDEEGTEHRGIRKIVEFVNHLKPRSLKIEDIHRDHDVVRAIVRLATGGKSQRLQHTYKVGRGRLLRLEIERI